MGYLDELIRKCLISLVIYKAEGPHRTDLIDDIEQKLEYCLDIIDRESSK